MDGIGPLQQYELPQDPHGPQDPHSEGGEQARPAGNTPPNTPREQSFSELIKLINSEKGLLRKSHPEDSAKETSSTNPSPVTNSQRTDGSKDDD